MKKIKTAFIVVIVLSIAGLLYAYASRHEKSEGPVYKAERPYLRASFNVPAGWKILAEDGKIDKYSQVMALGPFNAKNTSRALFIVRGSPPRSAGGRFEKEEEVKNNYLLQLIRKPVTLTEAASTVAGAPAETIVTTRTQPALLHRGLTPLETDLKEKAVLFRVGNVFYEIIYSADRADYDRFSRDFESLLKTFAIA